MVLLFFIGIGQLLGIQPGDSRAQVVTISKQNVPLIEVLHEIENQTGLTFFYSNEDVDTHRRVTVKCKNAPLTNVLDDLFSQVSITYKISDTYIVLTKISSARMADTLRQTVFVSGVVKSADGEILPGVNISEKETTNGSVTDTDGKYSLRVSSKESVLTYSFIGFKTVQLSIRGNQQVDVTMHPDLETLSEVVVIGYGVQRRRDVTGSIVSITGAEINQLPVMSAEQGMQGRLAGVTITQDASPGANVAMRIRGMGTIGDNDPLFIIDGVQTTDGIANINPGDIESIDVLKDASAAVYGSRSANGVVIVSTKHGRRGSSTKVDFSAYTGLQQRWRKVDVLNAKEYVRIISESQQNANAQRAELGSALLEPLPADFVQDNVRSLTDWQDEIFRDGMIQNYQLAVSGGTDKTNFMFSGSFRQEDGIIINSSHRRYTLRLSVDHDLSPRISFGSALNLSFTDRQQIVDNDIWNGVLQSAISMPEMFPVKDDIGNYYSPAGGNASIYGNSQNPVGQAERTDSKNPKLRVMGNVNGAMTLLEDLKFKSIFGFDLEMSSFKYYQPTFPEGSRPATVAFLYQSSTESAWWNWENTLDFSKRFGYHNISVMAGMSAQRYGVEYFSAFSSGFPQGDYFSQRYLRYGSSPSNDGFASANSLLSFFGRASYDFGDRYFVSGIIRRDGSSRFFRNRWGTFPSVSVGWRISEERFLKSVGVIDNLKLRASWGQLGNQSVGSDYPWVTAIDRGSSYNTVLGGVLQPGIALTQWGNENLTWETTMISDVGLDIGIFDDRLNFTFDYFDKRTRDMLLQVPLSNIAGQAKPPYVNAGAVRNTGYEFSASYSSGNDKRNYKLTGNVSLIRNKVIDLAGVDFIVANNTLRGSEDISRTAVGSSIGSYYGYKTDGIFQNDEEIAAHAKQEVGTKPGDIRFKDLSGPNGLPDGIINAYDRTILGDGFPDFSYGLSFTGRTGKFDAYIFLQGVSGVSVFNGLEYLTLNNQGGNKTSQILDYWTELNRDAAVPRLTWDDPNRNIRISDRYIHDGSYLRMKNVQVGYTFGKLSYVERLRLYFSVQNLFTITRYTGFDPEVGIAWKGYGSDVDLGVDQGRYPQARMFIIGLTMTL
jgi:TonB-dependent starch-binding outer membrane protein SusC